MTGKVLIGGSPPVAGTSVTFISADNKTMAAPVNEDGSYLATEVPLGPAQVTINGPAKAPPGSAGRVGVPTKYGKAGNGLTHNVTKGSSVFDITVDR